MRPQHRTVPTVVAVALSLALAGVLVACATPASPGSTADPAPAAPVEVAGEGTVIQVGDAAPELCLGAVAASDPPQCTGPEIVGWDWDSVDGDTTTAGTTWGTYAITGTWDGQRLTVSSAIQLALYDPMPIPDPALDPENPGTTDEATLRSLQESIPAEFPVEVLSTWTENGYVFVRVLIDEDGSLQAWADEQYGDGVVQVRPALRTTS
jgi:hypothetical protein